MDADLIGLIGKRQAGRRLQGLQIRRQGRGSRLDLRWISLRSCSLQRDRIRKR